MGAAAANESAQTSTLLAAATNLAGQLHQNHNGGPSATPANRRSAPVA